MKETTTHHQHRWIRGFSRIGLVLGVIGAIGVMGIGAIAVSEVYRHVDFDYEKLACLLVENGNRLMKDAEFKAKATASQCGFFSPYDTYSSLQWQEFGKSVNKNGFLYARTTDAEKQQNAAVIIGWTLAIAVAAFGVIFFICWTIGWIFVGFAKS
jgi:hypothetical protein